MTLLDYVKQGNVEYLETAELDGLRKFKGENGDVILALAAYEGQLDCCKVIYKRCPDQLFCQNKHGNSILHHVSHHRGEKLSLLKFFLEVGAKEDNIKFERWCKLQNQDRETALLRTIQLSNHEAAKLLLEVDYDHKLQLLSIANNEGNTPLHLAVEHQDLHMVKLLVRDKLDFKYGTNRNGETPLVLAIRKAQSGSDISVQIRQLVLESLPDQIKVRIGDKRWTLLHYAACKGDLGVVKDIIRLCPDCVDIVDSEGQYFLHTAAKFEQIQLVKYFLLANELSVKVLNAQDNNGNTPLHIAALTGNEPMCQCFLYDPRVSKMTINVNGQKVLDAINFDYDKRRAGIYGLRERMNEKDLMDQSNFGLVVGTLIATVSFIAGITVPGGYITEGPNLCMPVLWKSISFEAFVISNNFALILSIFAVFNNICASYLHEREDIVYKLHVASLCSVGAMFAMMIAFMTGSYTVLSMSNRIAITICVTLSFLLMFVFHATWGIWNKKRCYRQSCPNSKY